MGLLKDLTAHTEASKLDEAQACLSKLKICMTEFPSLPPCGVASANAAQERMIARQTFEQAALLSVKSEDMVAFECNVAQLKPFYSDEVEAQSQLRYPVLGMNLLHLLVENRLAEFHSELELIPEEGRANECIAFALQLEQYLMEGSYSKVLNARSSCPQQFSFFMDGLVNRIRENIAECSEVAYQSLTLADAQSMMNFNSQEEMLSYIKDNKEAWVVKDGSIFFQQKDNKMTSDDIPAMRLISEALLYATELERIV